MKLILGLVLLVALIVFIAGLLNTEDLEDLD